MSESLRFDSPFRGWAMPKSYSGDLRERVIEAVEMGASRHEAAERFEVSVSSTVKWLQRWRESRSAAPKPRGGSVSPLEKCAARVLAVIAGHPDLTLMETVAELRKRCIRTSKSALSRFFGRHDITLKKSLQAAERERADVARARRRWIREQGMLDPARLVFIDVRRAVLGSGAQARRCCRDGQLRSPQGPRRPGGDRESGGDTALPAEVLARPQSHRTALQQIQGPPAQGCRANRSGSLPNNSRLRAATRGSRMCQLLQACRLCFHMSGNRF
jgi:transposase